MSCQLLTHTFFEPKPWNSLEWCPFLPLFHLSSTSSWLSLTSLHPHFISTQNILPPITASPAYITEEKNVVTDAITLFEIAKPASFYVIIFHLSCNTLFHVILNSETDIIWTQKYIKFFLMHSVSKNTAVSIEEDMTTPRDTPLMINVMTEQNDHPLPTTVANLTGVGRPRIDYRCVQQLSLPVEC